MSDARYKYEEQQKEHDRFLESLDRNVVLPPGKYWIGDPCYFVDDYVTSDKGLPSWSDVLQATLYSGEGNDEWFGHGKISVVHPTSEKKEGFVLCASTIHGDGGYIGSNDFEYGVDAGLLGAFDADCATAPLEECQRLGTLFVAEEPLEVSYTRRRISFRSGAKELIIYINA